MGKCPRKRVTGGAWEYRIFKRPPGGIIGAGSALCKRREGLENGAKSAAHPDDAPANAGRYKPPRLPGNFLDSHCNRLPAPMAKNTIKRGSTSGLRIFGD